MSCGGCQKRQADLGKAGSALAHRDVRAAGRHLADVARSSREDAMKAARSAFARIQIVSRPYGRQGR